jgi:folate-binding protein YgfZ
MTGDIGPEHGAFVDLSDRVKLRISGSDRLRYVNGQISNDVRKARDGEAIHACVLTAKGKINADVFIRGDGESLLLDADAAVRETLPARLERYVIADDVLIEDVTDAFALFHVIGPNVPALDVGHAQVRADRFGCAGADLWLEAAHRELAAQELSRALPTCNVECAETFRIERGIPRWGRELTEEIIPTEANLEQAAIDYAKGCYIGQEVISRIKMSGQTNKRLCGLRALSDARLTPEMRLSSAGDGKEVGWITSVATSARVGRQIALCYLKRGFQEPGLQLTATATTGETAAVEVTPLPFI